MMTIKSIHYFALFSIILFLILSSTYTMRDNDLSTLLDQFDKQKKPHPLGAPSSKFVKPYHDFFLTMKKKGICLQESDTKNNNRYRAIATQYLQINIVPASFVERLSIINKIKENISKTKMDISNEVKNAIDHLCKQISTLLKNDENQEQICAKQYVDLYNAISVLSQHKLSETSAINKNFLSIDQLQNVLNQTLERYNIHLRTILPAENKIIEWIELLFSESNIFDAAFFCVQYGKNHENLIGKDNQNSINQLNQKAFDIIKGYINALNKGLEQYIEFSEDVNQICKKILYSIRLMESYLKASIKSKQQASACDAQDTIDMNKRINELKKKVINLLFGGCMQCIEQDQDYKNLIIINVIMNCMCVYGDIFSDSEDYDTLKQYELPKTVMAAFCKNIAQLMSSDTLNKINCALFCKIFGCKNDDIMNEYDVYKNRMITENRANFTMKMDIWLQNIWIKNPIINYLDRITKGTVPREIQDEFDKIDFATFGDITKDPNLATLQSRQTQILIPQRVVVVVGIFCLTALLAFYIFKT